MTLVNEELIQELLKHDPKLEVTISDGYEFHFYHTKNIELQEYIDENEIKCLDIGIGGCKIDNE